MHMLKYVAALGAAAMFMGAASAHASEADATVPAGYDDGPEVYVKIGAGIVTEIDVEGDFAPAPGDESFELDGGSVFGGSIGIDFGHLRIEAGADRLDAEALIG